MTDAETIEAARKLFASDTPGDKLGRRLLAIAERVFAHEYVACNWCGMLIQPHEVVAHKLTTCDRSKLQ